MIYSGLAKVSTFTPLKLFSALRTFINHISNLSQFSYTLEVVRAKPSLHMSPPFLWDRPPTRRKTQRWFLWWDI